MAKLAQKQCNILYLYHISLMSVQYNAYSIFKPNNNEMQPQLKIKIEKQTLKASVAGHIVINITISKGEYGRL